MSKLEIVQKYSLSRNPFPPAAAGIDIRQNTYIPKQWKEKIEDFFTDLSMGSGVKAFPVIGEYGSGKTYLIKGYLSDFFEKKRLMPIYIENPGTQLYELVNNILRNIGRYEFAKGLWELCKVDFPSSGQQTLINPTFPEMLRSLDNPKKKKDAINEYSALIKDHIKLTDDEEIAHKFALIITETSNKSYFEYRDFIPGKSTSLVAERLEYKYLHAILLAITKIYEVKGIVLLIDEFEEIAMSTKISKKQSYEYLAALRHLLDISEKDNFWIIMTLTPDAMEFTKNSNPGLWDRFSHKEGKKLELTPFNEEEGRELLRWWLNRARDDCPEELKKSIFPFEEEFIHHIVSEIETGDDELLNARIMLPRYLVKMFFYILSQAIQDSIEPTIKFDYARPIIRDLLGSSKQ